MGVSGPVDTSHQLLPSQFQYKKRRIILDGLDSSLAFPVMPEILPTLRNPDYFMEPCLSELATRELLDPGYCSRVQDFTVGRLGYGSVKFIGKTDVRWLELDHIIKFNRHEIVVYEDESVKPVSGQGLNKAAEVTLFLQLRPSQVYGEIIVKEKLRLSTKRQGANFISFDPLKGEWKFSVHHFSRFGLSDNEEEDIAMEDITPEIQDLGVINGIDGSDIDEEADLVDPTLLSHSLPSHLGLDPVKMDEMRMLMFAGEDEDEDDGESNFMPSHHKRPFGKESRQSPLQNSPYRTVRRYSPPVIRKTPLALLEYNPGNLDSGAPGSILMAQKNKDLPMKTTKVDGFKLELKYDTPVSGSHSRNIVDAALFMGRSFRVGWGPNGVIVHTGTPVGSKDPKRVLTSVMHLEKVAIDKVARDESSKIREELTDFCFDSPLNLHREIDHETKEVGVGSFKLKLQKLVCNRVTLSVICRSYIEIIEKQLEVPGLSSSSRVILMHQVLVWELIRVLFSTRETGEPPYMVGANNDGYMTYEREERSSDVDSEALPLIRRAKFSYWLQESVCHRVQDEVSCLTEANDLEHILLLLTGRQVDAAVALAASRGDVRLACLLSQAGGSTVNRKDIARQLEIWKINGLDFNFIENDRIRLFELLAGNIDGALHGINIDWKRFLGLLMWYELPPDTLLPFLFRTYQHRLEDGRAPYPVPVYIDEGPVDETLSWSPGERFDLAYYLMLLHSSEESKFGALKTMFSALASTPDPLDHHMIWHQRAVLEAVGTFSSDDLHVLDMGYVSQLLCVGHCHWAIYVALHMPLHDDYPFLQSNLIREILFQYCETWSTQEIQRQFIEKLGIPSEWLHEALAIHSNYYGDFPKALEHYIGCENWQKAHTIFLLSVAHSLFLSAKHSEVWTLATSMEDHKSEIDAWDLGAGIYLSFYSLRSSLQDDNNTMTEMVSLENKNDACKDFFGRLKESLSVWEDRLPLDARVVYTRMAEEICDLLVADSGEGSTREIQLSCYDTIFLSPIPEDIRSSYLQEAVSTFTHYLTEAVV